MSKITPFPNTKPCFAHPGGKTRLLKHILPRIPAHRTYIEPFAGGLAVLLAKPRSSVEVVNDRNADLVTFFRYAKFHPEALKTELAGSLQSRRDFEEILANPGLTDLQRAARWYLLKVCSFAACSDSWGRSKRSYHGFDEKRHLILITAVSKRLQRVFIEYKDWEEILDFYETPESFTYFDPPYVTGDPGSAYDAFTPEQMTRLRARLTTLRGRWMLSCDNSPQCRQVFAGLESVEIPIKYSPGAIGAKRKQSSELLILSPGLDSQAINAA